MDRTHIHHLGVGSSASSLGGAIRLDPCPVANLGHGAVRWTRGPNLYLQHQIESRAPGGLRPVNAPGLAHLCIQALNGGAARDALEADGARFLSEPVPLGTGYHYAYGHDRAGRLLELESAPFLPDSPPSWFGHVAFVSEDAERLARFYAAVLDAPVTPGGRYRDNPRVDRVAGLPKVDVEVWWVRARDFTLEFWRYHAPAAQRVASEEWYSHLGLEADDLDAALDRVRAVGGTVEGSLARGPDGGAAWARDPDGNRVHLVELADPASGVVALRDRDALARAAEARAAGGPAK